MSWTDERVELLKKLWLDGRSASQISSELGGGVTRNAVIGKVHRMGMSGRAKAPEAVPVAAARPRDKQPARTVTPRPTGPLVRGNLALSVAPRPVAQSAPRHVAEVVIPISERVTIMELREAMCKWPLGDPMSADFRYCGAKAPLGGAPYCGTHAKIAYQPTMDRRARDRKHVRIG